MAVSRTWLVALVAMASVFVSGSTVVSPAGAAERAVLIPGATVFKRINPIYPIIAATYPYIGIDFHADDHPQVVDYSQDALASDRALRDGVAKADIAVRDVDGPVVVIGESMGSMVASRLAAQLAASSEPPAQNELRFVLIASPEEGVAQYFKVGTFIPILNYRVRRVAQSPYPTAVVIGEYDGWADPPDRPWNLVALANALFGVLYVHGPPSWFIDPADAPAENITVNGNVTTYFVPTEHLPLTRPLRDIGVPAPVVDLADRFLRPVVDAGYRRHDEPGDTRPYLADGEIQRGAALPQIPDRRRREDADTERRPHLGRQEPLADGRRAEMRQRRASESTARETRRQSAERAGVS
ncbi:PE-PPE domain-containing protein [Mycolicibacterium duvalii]|uniref:PE-PPE domain-containing protein n=1 Tax=Mycolicibacterium duvalii TaxID=39688 RepID=A0A7I7K463_9MYCO|nr:PE-PPE domain-containing protein [Mycolicibacterium duvalii]MCV7369161.1 PE-PPE domain-containing protein [Mycolicibacterium duvalii]PEG44191.1 PE-PPE domain-containing protein [Mycolicibacterium duvalii]BBX18936.1 hypothetical protein MDUV_37960 [Mycolicibacterium duvalii]